MIINVLIGAIVAIIFYVVATALVHFQHSPLIFGLIAVLIFVVLAFGNGVTYARSNWRRPPSA